MKKIFTCILALVLGVSSVMAEKPYKHSVGAYFGGLTGFTYKKYVREHFAVTIDLAAGLTVSPASVVFVGPDNASGIMQAGYTNNTGALGMWDATFAPNFLGTGHISPNWSMYGGGGFNGGVLGFISQTYDGTYYGPKDLQCPFNETIYGKLGLNLVWGVEYKVPNKPVAIGIEARPGMGIAFHAPTINVTYQNQTYEGCSMLATYFDWKVALAVRYCWGN